MAGLTGLEPATSCVTGTYSFSSLFQAHPKPLNLLPLWQALKKIMKHWISDFYQIPSCYEGLFNMTLKE